MWMIWSDTWVCETGESGGTRQQCAISLWHNVVSRTDAAWDRSQQCLWDWCSWSVSTVTPPIQEGQLRSMPLNWKTTWLRGRNWQCYTWPTCYSAYEGIPYIDLFIDYCRKPSQSTLTSTCFVRVFCFVGFCFVLSQSLFLCIYEADSYSDT